jgi:hypothetical protein
LATFLTDFATAATGAEAEELIVLGTEEEAEGILRGILFFPDSEVSILVLARSIFVLIRGQKKFTVPFFLKNPVS